MIHRYSSLEHYAAATDPIWQALPEGARGGSHAPQGRPWGSVLPRGPREGLWLVAGASDVTRLGPDAACVLADHGAGQQYAGDPSDERACRSSSYAGGDGMDSVRLFLCPNQSAADRWQARYPDAATAVVGAPSLDRWHDGARRSARAAASGDDASDGVPSPKRTAAPGHGPGGPVVAAAFHWPNSLCPEAGTAWTHYRAAMPALRDAVAAIGGEMVGHGHPRAWRQYRREWARIGVRPVTLDEVYTSADLLVVDNSSCGPEFASLGRPIVWCSAPWWRRDVQHEARFWTWTDGMPHVEQPEDLVATVLDVLADPGRWDVGRERMVASVYSACDGRAAERAASAILALVHQGG